MKWKVRMSLKVWRAHLVLSGSDDAGETTRRVSLGKKIIFTASLKSLTAG
jgi:hypothetical protein